MADLPSGRSAAERRIEVPAASPVVDVVAERNRTLGPKRQLIPGVDVVPSGRTAAERNIDIPPVT